MTDHVKCISSADPLVDNRSARPAASSSRFGYYRDAIEYDQHEYGNCRRIRLRHFYALARLYLRPSSMLAH